jgi:hypothetical protein
MHSLHTVNPSTTASIHTEYPSTTIHFTYSISQSSFLLFVSISLTKFPLYLQYIPQQLSTASRVQPQILLNADWAYPSTSSHSTYSKSLNHCPNYIQNIPHLLPKVRKEYPRNHHPTYIEYIPQHIPTVRTVNRSTTAHCTYRICFTN